MEEVIAAMAIRYTEVRALAPNFNPKQAKSGRGRQSNPYVSDAARPTFVADTPDGAVWSYRGNEIVVDDVKSGGRKMWSAIVREGGDSHEETTAQTEQDALAAGKLVVDLRLYDRALGKSDRQAHRQLLRLAESAVEQSKSRRRADVARSFQVMLGDPEIKTKYSAGIKRWNDLPLQTRLDLLDEMIAYHMGYLGEFENPSRRRPRGTARDLARARRIANGGWR